MKTTMVNGIEFEELENTKLEGNFSKEVIEALTISVAGRHHIMFVGRPGCDKTLLMNQIPLITPLLTPEESADITKIYNIAGLKKPENGLMKVKPFRMPHQTAMIEGICGGGVHCLPGEMSFAHNGTLFLDETHEFRSSVIQMMRIPLENHSITLSRAGRSTIYPTHFQLAMATNPCPCGNYGVDDHICLCSAKSVEMYWKKVGDPLMDKIGIRMRVESTEEVNTFDLNSIRESVAKAYKAQRERNVYNEDISLADIDKICNLNDECTRYLTGLIVKYDLSNRDECAIKRIARTVADINETEITTDCIKKAYDLRKTNFLKF